MQWQLKLYFLCISARPTASCISTSCTLPHVSTNTGRENGLCVQRSVFTSGKSRVPKYRCVCVDVRLGICGFCFIRQQLALTHPSYHLNFGMNPDHARNSLSNCGVKQPRYGDRKIRHLHTRKKGMAKYREIRLLNYKQFHIHKYKTMFRKQGLSLIKTFYNPRGRIKTRFVSDVPLSTSCS